MKGLAACFLAALVGCVHPPDGLHSGSSSNTSPEAKKLIGHYRLDALADRGALGPEVDLTTAQQVAAAMSSGDNAQNLELGADGKYRLLLRKETFQGEWNVKSTELILSDPELNGVRSVEPAIPGRLKIMPDGTLEYMRTKESTTGADIIIRYIRA